MACRDWAAKVGGGVLGRVWALVAALALLLGLIAMAPAPAQAASFKDVPSGQWYTSWVDKASDQGLMSGFTDPATGRPTGCFGPDEPLTRAQVATVLWRMAGGPSSGHASFPDVERGSWYDAPVAWCVKAGVVTGYTSGPDRGCFRPDRPVTRQELATMVWRYAKYAGMDVADPDPSAFRSTTDWRTADSWASDALTWTAAAGVLSGVDNHDGTYSVVPFGTATRAMAAKVFVVLSGSPSAAKASYTVTFDSNGGSAVKAQAVRSGAKATKPSDPTKANLSFVGWYTDKALKKPYDFNSTITSNVTLYAKWGAVTAILYSDGLLSIQLGDDVDSSHGHVVQKWTDLSQITVFWKRAPEVKSVVVRDRLKLDNLGSRFSGMSNCRMMDLSKLDVSGVESFAYMFSDCEALRELNLTGWDVSRAKVFAGMFQGCAALTAIDIREWAPARPGDLGHMFSGCTRLSDLRLPAWDTSRVTDFGGMFSDCRSLGSFDLSGWDTSNGDDFGYMFWHCVSIQKLDLSSFDMSNAKTVSQMFAFCSSLQELNLSGWSTSKVTKDDALFFLCNSLQSITIGSDFTLQARIPSNSPWYDSEGNEYLSIPIGAAGTFTKTRPPERECTVSFDANDGSPVNAQTVSYGSKAPKPSDPVREGYIFTGWYVDSGLKTAYDFNSVVKSSFTLYAGWEIKTYTVTFQTDGGSAVASQTVKYGSKISKPANPTREGFTFVGWCGDVAPTEPYDFDLPVKSDLVLRADWRSNQFTVYFQSNGGSSIESQMVESGALVVLPDGPVKTGFSFAGWYTDEALTTAYDFSLPVESDMTLYARWDIKMCRVDFSVGSGSPVGSQIVEYGSKAIKPADPSWAGYSFLGWFSDESFTKAFSFDSAIESDLVLYAKWEREPSVFTVTFKSNGGSSVDAQVVTDGSVVARPANPVREGYDFVGWYTDAYGVSDFYNFETSVESNLVLYAGWRKPGLTYGILYNDGLLSLQVGPDEDISHGVVQGKWVFDGSTAPWYEETDRIESVVVRDKISPNHSSSWFFNLKNCKSMDLTNLEVGNVRSFFHLFWNCSSLESLNLSGWDTSSVTDFYGMFSDCSSLQSLDLSGWDVSSATRLGSMFSDCSSLQSLDLSGWDVSNASDLSWMFYGCSSLQPLDLSGWGVPNASDLSYMFSGCSSLTSLDLSGWGVPNASDLSHAFSGCSSLASLDLSGWGVPNASDLSWMFYGCSSLQSLDLSGWGISHASDFSWMFSRCSSLTTLDLSGWDVSSASDLSYMFSHCSSLQSLDLSDWDVSNAADLSGMFYDCSPLNTVTLGAGCGSLVKELPNGPWYDAAGKGYDRPPAGVAGTFAKTKPAVLALAADGVSDADALPLAQIVEGEQGGLHYVVVPESAPFEYGLEYPELAGRYVGPGTYLTGYVGGCESLVVPLEVAGVPVVSANLSWNDSDRAGMTRLAAVSFERVEGKASSLAQLDVSGNGLSSLDIEGLGALVRLNCEGNPIADFAALQAWAAVGGHEARLSQMQEVAPAQPTADGNVQAPSDPQESASPDISTKPAEPANSEAPSTEPGEPSVPATPAESEQPSGVDVSSEPDQPGDDSVGSDMGESDEQEEPADTAGLGVAGQNGDASATEEPAIAVELAEAGEGPLALAA